LTAAGRNPITCTGRFWAEEPLDSEASPGHVAFASKGTNNRAWVPPSPRGLVLFGYGRAGMAGIMIEDQVSPKRCGHVEGKSVVSFKEAYSRVKAACDARDEYESQFGTGTGPLILARTDALKTDGFEAAIERCLAFQEAGCDMTFLEAPESVEQMEEYCRRVKGAKLANMLEQGSTPVLSPRELKKMGYTMAAYPLTLLSASIKAMTESLERIQLGQPTEDLISSFQDTKDVVGFTSYAKEEQRYKTD